MLNLVYPFAYRIQSRDYEQITEKPEKTLANLARIEEEQMRRDRKAKERQYGQVNTITGAARSIRRPAMNAEYLASGGFDEDEGGDVEELAFERLDRERAATTNTQKNRSKQAPAPKAKQGAAPKKKKGPVSSDYLEYDEEDGSAMEDNDEDDDGDDVMIDDHDDDDEEEEDEDEEDEDEVIAFYLLWVSSLYLLIFTQLPIPGRRRGG